MSDVDVTKLKEAHQLIWDALKSGMPEVKETTGKIFENAEMTESVSDDVRAMCEAYIQILQVVVDQAINIGELLSENKQGADDVSSR